VGRDSVQAFLYDGYWNYARSVDAYHQAHRDLLGETPPIALADWAVRTRKSLLGLGDPPPVRLESGGRCARSLVAPGAHVAGEVDGSVLSPGVSVEPGARVTDSVLLDGVRVCAGARVDRAILDKRVEVGAGARIGCGEPAGPNRAQPRALAGGTSLIGKDARLPADCTVGRNCVVAPGTGEGDWSTGALASGDSLEGAEGGPA
jgi:glucose-1-phosphate adenylyltransferase